jgi:hypothetical protein
MATWLRHNPKNYYYYIHHIHALHLLLPLLHAGWLQLMMALILSQRARARSTDGLCEFCHHLSAWLYLYALRRRTASRHAAGMAGKQRQRWTDATIHALTGDASHMSWPALKVQVSVASEQKPLPVNFAAS